MFRIVARSYPLSAKMISAARSTSFRLLGLAMVLIVPALWLQLPIIASHFYGSAKYFVSSRQDTARQSTLADWAERNPGGYGPSRVLLSLYFLWIICQSRQ